MVKPPYTRAQVLAASPKRPALLDAYSHNHYHVFDALTAMLTGDAPTMRHWGELANVANILEALRQQRQITDDDGMIACAIEALGKARSRPALRFDAAGRYAMIDMLAAYVECCKGLSERSIKSAVNYAHNAQRHLK